MTVIQDRRAARAANAWLEAVDPQALGALAVSTVAALGNPDPVGRQRFVSDEAGGPVLVVSDGTDWRRVTDRRVASALPLSLMFVGQSNSASTPPATLGYSAMTQHLGLDLLGFNHTTQAFTQLVDGSASARANFGGSGTGPGPGAGIVGTILMRHIANQTGQTVRCFAGAYSGQNIDYFLPASVTLAFFEDGTQHATLNNYNWLKTMVATGGVVPQLYVWCQGEANAGTDQATYYGKLKTLFDQTRTDYLGIKWLLIKTIGAGVAGVRAAQQQLADENPNTIIVVDNVDMMGSTTFWREVSGPHYTIYAGYEEVGERCFAVLRGEARPSVPVVAHVDDLVSWVHSYQYTRSFNGADVAVWSDGTGTKSLTPGVVASVARPGLHIAAHALFRNRTVIDLDASNSECYENLTLTDTGTSWTWLIIGQLDLTAATKTLFEMNDGVDGDRIALQISGAGGNADLFYQGSSLDLPGSPAANMDPHVWMLTVDGPGMTAKLYVDGVFAGQATISGVANLASTRLYVASLSGAAQFIDGRLHSIRIFAGIADAQQAADVYKWAQVEALSA